MKEQVKLFWEKNDLAMLLFLSIFMNGFETGGYQAALLYVGQDYNLPTSAQGLMVAVELFATMIAPVLFGHLADRIGKKIMLVVTTLARALSALVILFAAGSVVFAIGIFFLGMTTSIIQYVAIAEMDDAYPLTNHNRMGFIAATYAMGAVVAPLIVGVTVQTALGWKAFFASDFLISLVLGIWLAKISFALRELPEGAESIELAEISLTATKEDSLRPQLFGIFLLCFIMFIYVGVENGIGFFLNGYLYDVMESFHGYMALSLFWFAMIPSRILCGIFAKHRSVLLCLASIGSTLFLLFLAMTKSEGLTFVVIFILGIFCGAVYPNVLTYAADFAGKRTATVTAAITVATGIGGTVVSAAFGFWEMALGYQNSFFILAVIMALDIVVSIWVVKGAHKWTK